MQLQQRIDDLQAQRASEWFEILRRRRPEDMAAFYAWCRKSPLHIQEFLEITWTDRALDRLDPARDEDLRTLIADIAAHIQTVPHLTPAANPRGPRARWASPSKWAISAVISLLAVTLTVFTSTSRSAQEFATKVGEQRTVELLDSSIVTMNTDSEIQVEFADHARSVAFLRGEAVFRVTHDPSRPFRVQTRVGLVQAIGTQFNVYDRPEGVDVAVIEGRVRLTAERGGASGTIRALDLTAGQEARIRPDGSISRAGPADVGRVTAWSKRRLKFDDTPLEDMVHEFNRYQRTVKLHLEGVSARSHHYSGVFDADDPGAFARFLEQESDLRVEQIDAQIVIRPRIESRHVDEAHEMVRERSE